MNPVDMLRELNERLERSLPKKLPSGQSEKAWTDKMRGGAADDSTPGDFDMETLSDAIKDEMKEHTVDPHIAAEIAMDHLRNDPHYYANKKD